MRRLSVVIFLACLAVGWFLWNHNGSLQDTIQSYVENKEFLTFEARYTPEQIIEKHQLELDMNAERSFKDPELKFQPYVLMEVKYSLPNKKTQEGVIFWSMTDGEMVLDTETWEKTHGFEDAINAKATRNDFKVINALAKRKGIMTFDQLQNELHVDREMLQPWVNSASEKHLIIQKSNELQLHFQNPKILVLPETKSDQWLVTKPYNHAQRIAKKYSVTQVKNVAQSAFGEDFTIRTIQEVFLPIYCIEVVNPDGSILSTYWNALNGQKMNPKYLQRH